MFTITNYNHDSLMVADVERSAAFYRDVLGMREVPRPATFDFAGKWFRCGTAEIHLIGASGAPQAPGDLPNAEPHRARARHIAFEIADMDETVRHLQAQGIPIVAGPRPRGDGPVQVYVCDPDGHLIELCTRAATAG
ncbi:MAG: VOC family protein [Chloroflexi bacterium]|nr:VOC family protein [Chloroflexota bacterium]